VCYVSRDLPVVAEAPVIVAEVVIVIVAVAVFVDIYVLEVCVVLLPGEEDSWT
jgi:hypothetical protein